MPRDPLIEAVGEKMEYIYSKAQKLVVSHYPDIARYDQSYRIAIIAYMKMIVDLLKLEEEKRQIK